MTEEEEELIPPPLLIAHRRNSTGWNGHTTNGVDFSSVLRMLSAQICFFSSSQPLCLIFLACILQLAELKLIFILHANTTFQPLFLFFFLPVILSLIFQKPHKIFSPSEAADSAGHFSFWKAKPFPVQVLLKMICFFLALEVLSSSAFLSAWEAPFCLFCLFIVWCANNSFSGIRGISYLLTSFWSTQLSTLT